MKKFLSNPANLIFSGIIIALLFYLVFAEKGVINRIRLEIEVKKLKKEIQRIENENASLREKIHKLETDPKEVEKLPEKNGMAKEGEVVFIVKEK
ncbi:MAG: septum formation initiator family protein [Candidatus Kryptonium sp.]